MFCSNCGKKLQDAGGECRSCGYRTEPLRSFKKIDKTAPAAPMPEAPRAMPDSANPELEARLAREEQRRRELSKKNRRQGIIIMVLFVLLLAVIASSVMIILMTRGKGNAGSASDTKRTQTVTPTPVRTPRQTATPTPEEAVQQDTPQTTNDNSNPVPTVPQIEDKSGKSAEDPTKSQKSNSKNAGSNMNGYVVDN